MLVNSEPLGTILIEFMCIPVDKLKLKKIKRILCEIIRN